MQAKNIHQKINYRANAVYNGYTRNLVMKPYRKEGEYWITTPFASQLVKVYS